MSPRAVALPVPTEATEQTWLFEWINQMAALRWPELELAFHIPNGGSRNKIEAARMKAQGIKAGVPDVFISVPRCGYHGLYIEMKRQRGGKVEEAQKELIPKLRAQGYRVEICKGFHPAADLIEQYMTGKLNKEGT